MSELIERTAKLFEAGDYQDKGVSITEADIQALVDSFAGEVPVKIQHTDTAFDGMLGAVKSVWRRGGELLGRIAFAPDVWSLIDRCSARRLSVGIGFDPLRLREVSIVDRPRVATAQVFAGGLEFAGLMEFGWAGLAASDVLTRIEELLNPTTLDADGYPVYAQPYGWVESLYEDSVVVARGGRWYRHTLSVSDGEVTLGQPEQVVRDWQPVGADNGEADNGAASYSTRTEDYDMAENTISPPVVTMSQEEFDSRLSAATEAARAEARVEAEELIAKFRAESAASELVSNWLRSGLIRPEQEQFARAIVAAGGEQADAFGRFLEASASEDITGETDPQIRVWDALGVTADAVAKAEERMA